ncbi:cupin domain-containing protein [Paenibacillus gorillae]|uniref:cupin domain-containing protein n=1 Tax=Paenibacillus gorillae TaxID=1243662 RepID=UPI0004BBF9EF|nr:cupin domain-containing protein [Paenibacillus gorillae]
MRELIIQNINNTESKELDNFGGSPFTVKHVIGGSSIDQCEVSFVEVPPGQYAYGYHYHDQSEEVFYIISGEGSLRTIDGDKQVSTGDMLCFPKGEKGSHLLTNTSSTDKLVYIDFAVRNSPADIAAFPDLRKYMIIGEHINAMVDMPENK